MPLYYLNFTICQIDKTL